MPAYQNKDLVDAMHDIWQLLQKFAPQEELDKLIEKHPALDELNQSGPNGYCGIGLGNYGGHATG